MSDKKYRKCSKCGNFYPETLDYFHKSHGGLLSYCKLCRNKQEKKHYQKSRKQILETKKEYRERNKETLNKKSREFRENFKEKFGFSHSGIHSYIKKRFPKPNKCNICCKEGILELSNISGEYKKDLFDWQWVHKKCHMGYDLGLKTLPEVVALE